MSVALTVMYPFVPLSDLSFLAGLDHVIILRADATCGRVPEGCRALCG